jgi:hypothetical protein
MKFQADIRRTESGKYEGCPRKTPARHESKSTSLLQNTVRATKDQGASLGADSMIIEVFPPWVSPLMFLHDLDQNFLATHSLKFQKTSDF